MRHCSDIYFRSPEERIIQSMDVAVEYINANLPGYFIKPVPGDGLCIINAFAEGLRSIGFNESFNCVVSSLKQELQREIYHEIYSSSLNGVSLVGELNQYLANPLAAYDSHISDIYLEALSMAYEVNIIIFQSSCTDCRILENINKDNFFQHTLYFVRTESLHFDPVIPIHCKEGLSDSSGSLINTDLDDGPNNANSEVTVDSPPDLHKQNDKWVPEEHGGQQDNTDLDDGPNDATSELTVDSLPDLHRQSVKCVPEEHGGHTLSNMSNTSAQAPSLGNFNYKSPSGLSLFQALLVEPTKYEVPTPLKRVRENRMYTVRNCSLSDITCDDNGSYRDSNSNSKLYYVKMDGNSTTVSSVNEVPGKPFYYRERVGRKWANIDVSNEYVYKLVRYYRSNKTIPGLKMMVVTVESHDGKKMCPYFCVVYSLETEKSVETLDDDIIEVVCLPHGNSKQPSDLSQPYIRTNPSILKNIDSKLEKCSSASSVFYDVLVDSGGPMNTLSQANQPRNTKQVNNRKSALTSRKENPQVFNAPQSDLDKLIRAQRDPNSPVRTVVVWQDTYIAFVYTDKMLKDIELFACDEYTNEACVLGVDTTFGLCGMWVTDTVYRNKRLTSVRSRKNPVHLGPVMFHSSKDDETFRRFCAEIVAANPNLLNLRKIGVDMESAIFNGFQSIIPKLLQLYCVKHLQDRDKLAIDKCHGRSNIADGLKASYKQEIQWDIYGKRCGDTFEMGIADATDSDEFNARLMSLQPRWGKLCPGFFQWFITNRKQDFLNSVIKSAREGTNVGGLYYQNDVESQHATEKIIQLRRKGSVLDAVGTFKTLSERQEIDEEMALYGSGNYVLSRQYKSWFSAQWHSWTQERKNDHKQKFRNCKPAVDNTFDKPVSVGRKPNQSKRARLSEPTNVIDRPSTLH